MGNLTSDLVSQLKAAADGNYNPGEVSALFGNAAKEIERLSSELFAAWNSLNEVRVDAEQAENRAFKALDQNEVPVT